MRSRDTSEDEGWGIVVERALAGDAVAYARLTRLVTQHLARLRAFDFRSDWDDIVQEVLISTIAAQREGRLDPPGALQAYVRQATRFKFIDRIRATRRRMDSIDEEADEAALAQPPPGVSNAPVESEAMALRLELAAAVDKLPDRERRAVLEVHVRGRTYEEAADATGIPLGTLKRALRTGLRFLREYVETEGSEPPPKPP